MDHSYSGKGIVSSFLDKFHPFAAVAAQHHGAFVEPYVARNIAELGGYKGEFDGIMAGSENLTSMLLTGRDIILHVNARYQAPQDAALFLPREAYDNVSRTFTFEAPEWVRPFHSESPGMRLFRLKCKLDGRLYRTEWISVGREISVAGTEGVFAYASAIGCDNLLYRCDTPEDASEEEALAIAEDLGLAVEHPVYKKVVEFRGITSDVPDVETMRRMRASIAHHQD